jgi:hypothetical protein
MEFPMKRVIQLSCLSLSFLVIALVNWQETAAARSSTQTQIIDALDDCIQQRFKEIDKYFGIRRIMVAGDTPHLFKPENARELASLKELQKRKLEAAIFLTSRSVLGARPEESEWTPDKRVSTRKGVTTTSVGTGTGFSRRIIKGPVLISARTVEELPRPIELWEQSHKAMQMFAEKHDSYEFTYGDWQFVARPVRASEQSCLNCHKTDLSHVMGRLSSNGGTELKIGDPLGVVLYAYRESK